MRRSLAIVGAAVLVAVLGPVRSAEATGVYTITASGQIQLWDAWECSADNPDPPNHCFQGGNFVEREPAEIYAPWAPPCSLGLCPAPDTYDWVFDQEDHPLDTPLCVGYRSPTGLAFNVNDEPDLDACSIDAIGRMTFGVTGGGPWCGSAGGDAVQGRAVTAKIAGQEFRFRFSFPVLMQQTGATATWLLRDFDTNDIVGTAVMALVRPHGSCGLLPPAFAPATGFDVTFTLTWTDVL